MLRGSISATEVKNYKHFFGRAAAENQESEADDVIFQRIFSIFHCRVLRQMTLIESRDKIGQDRSVLRFFYLT